MNSPTDVIKLMLGDLPENCPLSRETWELLETDSLVVGTMTVTATDRKGTAFDVYSAYSATVRVEFTWSEDQVLFRCVWVGEMPGNLDKRVVAGVAERLAHQEGSDVYQWAVSDRGTLLSQAGLVWDMDEWNRQTVPEVYSLLQEEMLFQYLSLVEAQRHLYNLGDLAQREIEQVAFSEKVAEVFQPFAGEALDAEAKIEMPEDETPGAEVTQIENQATETETAPETPAPVKASRRVEGEDKLATLDDDDLDDDLKVYMAFLECFRGGSFNEDEIASSLIVTRKWAAQRELETFEKTLAEGDEVKIAELKTRASKNLASLFAYLKVFDHGEHPTRHATWTAAQRRITRLSLVAKTKIGWNRISRALFVEEFKAICCAK